MRIELELDDALVRRIAERTNAEVFWSDPGLRRLIVTHLVHVGFEAKIAAERAALRTTSIGVKPSVAENHAD